LGVVALTLWLAACGGPRDAFIEGRVLDECSASWPACDRITGCILGTQSYSEGRFPGDGKFIVQLAEPSTVTLSFLLEDVHGAGEETVMLFHEERCRSRVRVAVGGKAFITEAENVGWFSRSADLTGEGDHLIEFNSDASTTYLVKVDVKPLREGAEVP
jgi:hypothetical protein